MTLDKQIAAAKREVALRANVYPKWVASGRMSQEDADHQLSAMRAIVATLEGLKQLTADSAPPQRAPETRG